MKVNRTFLLVLLIPVLLTIGGFYMYGDNAWGIWNIPTLQPPFIDTRIITAGSESFALGFNPEIENPQDPYGRLFNLPSAWKILFLTGINQDHTNIFAWSLIVFFWIAVISFANRVKKISVFLLTLCVFSPPVMLAIERGNVDLFIFFICTLSLIWMEKNRYLSLALLWIAGILKIYPVFGLVSFLCLDKKSFGKYVMFFIFAFGLYSLLTFDGFQQAFANTEVGFDLSYGLGVLPYYVEGTFGNNVFTLIVSISSILLVLIIAFLILYSWMHSHHSLIGDDSLYLSAFRLGAGIYIGTFLLGNNWDYRLIFLLFTLPQLADWALHNKMAGYTLLSIVISFFYLWIVKISPFAYFLDEAANWFTFSGLLYLMFVSLPNWAKDEIYLFFNRYKRNTT